MVGLGIFFALLSGISNGLFTAPVGTERFLLNFRIGV
jgi:hypothetical protein